MHDGTVLGELNSSVDPLAFDHTFANPGTYSVEIGVWNCDMTAPVTGTVEMVVIKPEVVIYLPLVLKN